MTIKINFNFEEWFKYNRKLIQDLKAKIFGKNKQTTAYCSKSINRQCKFTQCPRNLNGFYGQYIKLKEFDCKKEFWKT